MFYFLIWTDNAGFKRGREQTKHLPVEVSGQDVCVQIAVTVAVAVASAVAAAAARAHRSQLPHLVGAGAGAFVVSERRRALQSKVLIGQFRVVGRAVVAVVVVAASTGPVGARRRWSTAVRVQAVQNSVHRVSVYQKIHT